MSSSDPCGHWATDRWCGVLDGVRHFLTGPRCAAHTPAVLAGRPDHVPDPELTLTVLREKAHVVWGFNSNDTALADMRARVKGQRASGQQRRAAHE